MITKNILKLLKQHYPLIQSFRIVHYDETPMGKLVLKIRCIMEKDYQFQIWIHHESSFQDYSYQLFSDSPILRWNNAPHHPNVSTFPHHFHNERGEITESPLDGMLLKDVKYVLKVVKKWLSKN